MARLTTTKDYSVAMLAEIKSALSNDDGSAASDAQVSAWLDRQIYDIVQRRQTGTKATEADATERARLRAAGFV